MKPSVKDIQLYPVEQQLYRKRVNSVSLAVEEALHQLPLQDYLRPGENIAITAGSRGIANIPTILARIVQVVKECGAHPFLIPAMGSHGGATAEGQVELLKSLGVTEEAVGAPIVASMETVSLGTTSSGYAVFMDKNAWNADGIIVVNRIKPHTDFRGTYESGLMKMMAIGLGKRDQAEVVHSLGTRGLRELIPQVAQAVLNTGKVRCGLAILENGFGETAQLIALPPSQIPIVEPQLLAAARRHHPRVPFREVDILIVDYIGKDISGAGMDTNVIGRLLIGKEPWVRYPRVSTIITLDLTPASHGNAAGIGLADITTQRLLKKMDPHHTYTNIMVSTFIERGKIPPAYPSDQEALETALYLHRARRLEDLRIVRIRDTLHIHRFWASEAVLQENNRLGKIKVIGEPQLLPFDKQGNLEDLEGALLSPIAL